jgi:hypothetical protein
MAAALRDGVGRFLGAMEIAIGRQAATPITATTPTRTAKTMANRLVRDVMLAVGL